MCTGLLLKTAQNCASCLIWGRWTFSTFKTWNIPQYCGATIILHEESTVVFCFRVVWLLICICLCLMKAVVGKLWVFFIIVPSLLSSHYAMVSFLHIFSQSKGSVWCTSLTTCSSSLLFLSPWLHCWCWDHGGCMDFAEGNIPIKTMRRKKL